MALHYFALLNPLLPVDYFALLNPLLAVLLQFLEVESESVFFGAVSSSSESSK
jgi:hypothetical protein